MVLQRPVAVWIILAFIAYGVLGTASGLGTVLSGKVVSDPSTWIFGFISLAGYAWLFAEIWQKSSRQSMVAFANATVALVMSIVFYIAPALQPGRTELVAGIILTAMMVGIWILIALYLRHLQNTST